VRSKRRFAYFLRRRPLGLELELVEGSLEQPAEPGHCLHSIQNALVAARVLVSLVVPR
jgi:hypothetical protein